MPSTHLGPDGEIVRSGEHPDDPESAAAGTSIFDPVLTELSYHWYSGAGDSVLDPFAGGSVRGIVAAYCGRSYLGVDLRPEQVAANREQWVRISGELPAPSDASPEWRQGDARRLRQVVEGEQFDLVFSCPPYYDLEVYSDDPDDLSRAPSYEEFLDGYLACLMGAADCLRDDRFAVLVVSEIRDPKSGLYRGFVADTVRAAGDAGLDFYNDAVLINACGSLPLRTRRMFAASRKLGRSHQAVLTFVKGDPVRAARHAGPVAVEDFGGV